MGDAAVRRRLVRLAVLPSGAVAAVGTLVVGCVLGARAGAEPLGAGLWTLLVLGALLVAAALGGAWLLAEAEARGSAARCAALRRSLVRGQAELRSMLWALRHGERPVTRTRAPEAEPVGDALDLLGHQAALAQCAAESALVEAVVLTAEARDGGEERAEVFVGLARRLQSLVHREIELIDRLENEIEDPDLLKGVFRVDHVATRTRRHAENLAVLGGAAAHRRWTRPVSLSEALRSAVAEVEHYTRVQLVPPIEGTVHGQAVADVVHLLAELIENATVFSPPEAQVLVRTQRVAAGLAVEVEDRGPGMDPVAQQRLNTVLAEPGRTDATELVRDGRIGLYVVAALARRHGIVVQLRNNIYGGVQAVAVLPQRLLGRTGETAPGARPENASGRAAAAAGPGRRRAPGTTAAPGATPAPGAAPRPDEAVRRSAPGPVSGAGAGPGTGPVPAAGPGAPAPGAGSGADTRRPRPAADPATGPAPAAAPPADAAARVPEGRPAAGPGGAGSAAPAAVRDTADPRPRARARGKERGPATPLPFASSVPAGEPGGAEAAPGRPPLPRRAGQEHTAAEHDPAVRPRDEAGPADRESEPGEAAAPRQGDPADPGRLPVPDPDPGAGPAGQAGGSRRPAARHGRHRGAGYGQDT
ncbi:sensor histidine kinase [Streptomyces qinglanensis]|uniref:sensor histidine kinase n=1 Tax=Streptomyces qinglanensis TaxID=943816 RepID=UPI0009440F58|nr:ATP-binding protein [Streptomyces qinglanensis]